MSKLFKGLKKGLEEALAHTEGKITLKAALRLLEIVDKGFYRPRITKTVQEAIKDYLITESATASSYE